MPELPEVETIARGLADRVTGRIIRLVELYREDVLHGDGGPIERLMGRRIARVCRTGKQVRIDFDPFRKRPERAAPTMYVHLGMTGRLLVVDAGDPLEPHTHLSLMLDSGTRQLRFIDPRRFGGVWMVDSRAAVASGDGYAKPTVGSWRGRRLPPVGADPLTVSLPAITRLLARRRMIKALLLDQQPISGIGNIYCDELLHRAGIHPLTVAAELDAAAVRRIRQSMRRVLNEAIRAGGSSISDYRTADNTSGTFQARHRVYARAGRPCRRCGAIIERLVVAGRGTFVCPACQPAPAGRNGSGRV